MNNKESAQLFKKNITSVEIGTHNYCNRTCTFCPLSLDSVNRRDMRNTIFMKDEVYENIMKQLASIDFNGRLDFSRYHEPTSHKKYIIEKIKIARSYLPNANISLNTNSDYMNKEYHQQLLEAGVSNFAFQAYMKNGATAFDEDEVFKRINKICDKLGAPRIEKEGQQNKEWIIHKLPDRFKGKIHARNYWNNGVNRAGTVLDTNYTRTQPCTSMNKGVYIDYNGSMTACCDMLTPELHTKWEVGNLEKEPDLFLNYTSKFYTAFRDRITKAQWYPNSPCQKCKRDVRGKQAR
jgi:radical SAM protein with 4Fe4S-binding SPASM domain